MAADYRCGKFGLRFRYCQKLSNFESVFDRLGSVCCVCWVPWAWKLRQTIKHPAVFFNISRMAEAEAV